MIQNCVINLKIEPIGIRFRNGNLEYLGLRFDTLYQNETLTLQIDILLYYLLYYTVGYTIPNHNITDNQKNK